MPNDINDIIEKLEKKIIEKNPEKKLPLTQIEKRINELVKSKKIKLSDVDTIREVKTFDLLEHTFSVYEAGWTSEGSRNNDCLFHSILSCISPTFRKISEPYSEHYNKNKIASYYRRSIATLLLPDRYKEELEGSEPLEDKIGELFCKRFGVNILYIQSDTQKITSVVFTDNKGKYTICIYGDNTHFQPVSIDGKFLQEDKPTTYEKLSETFYSGGKNKKYTRKQKRRIKYTRRK